MLRGPDVEFLTAWPTEARLCSQFRHRWADDAIRPLATPAAIEGMHYEHERNDSTLDGSGAIRSRYRGCHVRLGSLPLRFLLLPAGD